MVRYESIPVIHRLNGTVVEATRNCAWVVWPSGKQLCVMERQLERGWVYRSGARITPVSTGVLIEVPDHPPVYLTSGEVERIVEKIRELRAAAEQPQKETRTNV